jgi:hypothetical protein
MKEAKHETRDGGRPGERRKGIKSILSRKEAESFLIVSRLPEYFDLRVDRGSEFMGHRHNISAWSPDLPRRAQFRFSGIEFQGSFRL